MKNLYESECFYKALWKVQGIFGCIAIISFIFLDYLFLKFLFSSGNRGYTLQHFLLPQTLGFLMLVIITVGSFYKWRFSLFLNLLSTVLTIRTLVYLLLAPSSSNVSFGIAESLSNISLIATAVMNLAGIIIFSYFVRNYLKRKSNV